MSLISYVNANEVLDSRGNPTIEVEVGTEDRQHCSAIVPSGASTGIFEAHELRDGDPHRYRGRGVLKAVQNVCDIISPRLIGRDCRDQLGIDADLCEWDGSQQKTNLGANTILGVSLAVAKAGAAAANLPLYRYLGGPCCALLPVPLMNVLNGGAHADNNVDFQEFMIVPHGAANFREALRWGAEVYHALRDVLREKGLSTGIGDEGGFAPELASNAEALQLLLNAIESAGYRPAEDISLALDVAASTFYKLEDKVYRIEERELSSQDLIAYYQELSSKYPLISIEDGLEEQDWQGFQELTAKLPIQIVGDDLYVTNTERLERGIKEKSSNAILIKPNQIGTISETAACVSMAHKAGFQTIMSHRSGESEDTSIAHLAVAWQCSQIKTGAPQRSDRIAKYNTLLRIESELGDQSRYQRPRW